ncbi:MAG TPA: SprT family zinc-dependent metalloprotease [Bacteroidales bacterium]|nr:SprT family zinc-dependent metalloprotease [Bacteroidales bacterium]
MKQQIKLHNYKHIGDVHYIKNSKAKNLSIRINSEGTVRVTVPRWCSYTKAEQFFKSKHSWVIKKCLEIERKNQNFLAYKVGDLIPLYHDHIEIRQTTGDRMYLEQSEKGFLLFVPGNANLSAGENREGFRELMKMAGLQSAKKNLPVILEQLSREYSLPYGRVTVRRMRTRWGSCSHRNNISLSSGLTFLDEELIRYVCLHELVHTVHKNHSPAFWNALSRILPDYKNKRKKLREKAIIA